MQLRNLLALILLVGLITMTESHKMKHNGWKSFLFGYGMGGGLGRGMGWGMPWGRYGGCCHGGWGHGGFGYKHQMAIPEQA